MEKGISFKQQRDFGQVFTHTFSFLIQEFRPLGLALLYNAFPFILISAISIILFLNRFKPFFTNPEAIPSSGFLIEIVIYCFLILLIFLISKVLLLSTVNNYIALYIEKGKGNFTAADVSKRIGSNFWQILFTIILTWVMIEIGYLFCILPAIYLAVSMCFVYIAIAYDKKGFGDALSRSFEISHVQWWGTLLLLIIIYLIILIISSIPFLVFIGSMVKTLSIPGNSENLSPEKLIELMKNVSYLIAVLTILSSLLSIIPMVAIALQYMSIVEFKARKNEIQLQN